MHATTNFLIKPNTHIKYFGVISHDRAWGYKMRQSLGVGFQCCIRQRLRRFTCDHFYPRKKCVEFLLFSRDLPGLSQFPEVLLDARNLFGNLSIDNPDANDIEDLTIQELFWCQNTEWQLCRSVWLCWESGQELNP